MASLPPQVIATLASLSPQVIATLTSLSPQVIATLTSITQTFQDSLKALHEIVGKITQRINSANLDRLPDLISEVEKLSKKVDELSDKITFAEGVLR